MRDYFATLQLTDGSFVTFVYSSAYRKNTSNNWYDFVDSLHHYNERHKASYRIDDAKYTHTKYYRGKRYQVRSISDYVYILNEKNMDEQCFGDCEVIDLR